jgi:ABC-type nitrate/sulfonate/bicarbonate transport system substrate-binding protein
MALHRGFLEDVGLDVWAGSPLEPNRPASYVAKGTDDFGVVQQPQVVIAREKGMPIVAIGSVISLKGSKIRGIRGLEGKTIAVPGIPYQERFLRALLARAGLTLMT